MGIIYHEFLLIATCEKTNFVHAIPMQNRQTETIANALLHRVCCLTGPPMKLSIDQDAALTSVVIKEMLTSLECVGVSRGYTDYHQGRAIHMADSRIH